MPFFFRKKKIKIIVALQFHTLYKLKLTRLKPLLSVAFPQRFGKSKKFGHWTLGRGGKKTFKWSEQMKKICIFFFFAAAILHPLWAKVLKSETPSFHYFFLKSKIFGHWTFGSGGNRHTDISTYRTNRPRGPIQGVKDSRSQKSRARWPGVGNQESRSQLSRRQESVVWSLAVSTSYLTLTHYTLFLMPYALCLIPNTLSHMPNTL